MSHYFLRFVKRLAVIVGLAILLIPAQPFVLAATATPASDVLSNQSVGASSNHQIVFKTPTGVDAPTDTIVLTMPNFVFGSVAVTDFDLHWGPTTGFENSAAIAAVAGAGVWGASITGTTITLTAPTDAAIGTVPSNSLIAIRIGTNAGGLHQLINPSSSMLASVGIAGSFGDSNTIHVLVSNDGAVSVTATVVSTSTSTPSIPGGGGGGSTINPPAISSVQAINITTNSARIVWATDKDATSRVDYGFTTAHTSGTQTNATLTSNHIIDLTGLSPSTQYHYIVTSVDSSFLTATSIDYVFTTSGDNTPPLISDVHVVSITDSSGIVMWTTDEPANSFVGYGTSTSYGSALSSAGYVVSHALPLTGLSEGTQYHYRVSSTDVAGNSSTSSDYVFTTTIDSVPPANVTLTATPGDALAVLSWTLPPDTDYMGTILRRKVGGYPTGSSDGILVYDGSATTTIDTGLTNGTTYYYAAYAYDTHHNYASGALATAIPVGTIVLPPTPTSTPSIPSTPTTTTELPPTPTSTPSIPSTPTTTTELPPTPTSTPSIPSTPTTTTPVATTTPSVTETPTTTTPVATTTTPVPPTTAIPGAVQIAVNFYAADGTIELIPDGLGQVGVLNGTSVLVSMPIANLGKTPSSATFTVGGSAYSMQLSTDGKNYLGTFVAPKPGRYASLVTANFSDKTVGQVSYNINSQFGGVVVEQGATGPTKNTVPEASVQVYREVDGKWEKYLSSLTTSKDGSYGLAVPNGRYYAEIIKSGYRKQASVPITVEQNVFNDTLSLIKEPKSVTIPAGTPLAAALAITASNATEQIVYGVKVAREVVESPQVQAANSVAAPTLLTVMVVNSASAVSFFNLLAYLQYLFTQPILLFGRRKKQKWGVVFNSLTKQPIDLGIVRLVHFETKLVMQTVVTDKYGRYRFLVQKGNYLLEIVKPGYVFPTAYLGDKKEDVDYLDLYHGEKIEIASDSVIASNVPLDPVLSEETPRRVLLRKTLTFVRQGFAFSGIPFGIVILAVTPNTPNALLLLAQIGVYVLFRRLSMPAKPKSWGMVFDAARKQPVRGAIVRIFDKKFNKLLETQVTDRNGKYGFFVRRNIYYITAEKAGYKKYTSPDIDLSTKDEAIVDQNVPMMSVDK